MAREAGGRRWSTHLVVLLVVVLVVGGLTLAGAKAGLGSSSKQAADGGTFVMTNLSDPDPIDPALVSHTMSRTFVRTVYETLVYYKLGTTAIVPVLATQWKVSRNGRVYTFQL